MRFETIKAHRILAIAGLILVSQLALAEEQKPDPKAFALTEAVLAYCAKAEPATAAKFKDRLHLATKRVSHETLSNVRKSDAYRHARESMDEFLGKVDEHNAGKVCSRRLAQSQ